VQRLEQEVEAAVALVSKERQKHDATVLSLQEALQDAVRQVRRVNSAISRRGLRLFELHPSTQMESIRMQHMDAMLEAAKQMRDCPHSVMSCASCDW
jgi:predicted nucleic acid-binding protein